MAYLQCGQEKATAGELCFEGGGQIVEMRLYVPFHASEEGIMLMPMLANSSMLLPNA